MTSKTVRTPIAVTGAPTESDSPERRRSRRWRIVAPLVAVVALALAAAACAPPGSPGSGPTGDALQAMNRDRAAAGIGPLAWDTQLGGLAQSHAQEIANSGSLWHSDLASWMNLPWMTQWRALGENLLVAPAGTSGFSAESVWMGSAPHRANILNGGFNHVGVGVVTDGAGREWMVAEFGAR
jgi:uncharacterized protein YkwD